jgi:ribosomal protein L11 methyltransferase
MPWLQVGLYCDQDRAERWSELLEEAGARAVSLQDAEDHPLYEPDPGRTPLWHRVRVVGLFEAGTEPKPLMQRLARAMGQAMPPPWSAEHLEDRDWERAWMERFAPMRFGTRLWVCPGWRPVVDPEAVNIRLDPGLAFGTGTHPTTALCLEWLDLHMRPGWEVVDYGCGSGILALAAAKLGARRVWAVDNDPQALLACRENAERNQVDHLIEVADPTSFSGRHTAPADLVLANILAGPLIDLAPRLTGLVRPGGQLLLSGILEAQTREVQDAYRREFRIQPASLAEGWVRLEGRRPGASDREACGSISAPLR